jgi:hypothetical protein
MGNNEFLFINISNHPFEKWSPKQQRAALELTFNHGKTLNVRRMGKDLTDEELRKAVEVADVPFPEVPLEWDENFAYEWLLGNYYRLLRRVPDVIMIQGEFTFSFFLVNLLMKIYPQSTLFVSAHSRRLCVENPDGTRTYKFEFDGFNIYRREIPKYWEVSLPSWRVDPSKSMQSLSEHVDRKNLEEFLQKKLDLRVVEKRIREGGEK